MITKSHKVANSYARAFFELAKETKVLAKTQNDVNQLKALLEQSPEFKQFINNPIIPVLRQHEILKALFHGKVHASTLSFLLFLSEHKRLSRLERICSFFEKLYLQAEGILKIKITSVCAMEESQVKSISEKFKKIYAKDIEPQQAIDKGLLGGFKVQVQDVIYDCSVKTQLENFRRNVLMV